MKRSLVWLSLIGCLMSGLPVPAWSQSQQRPAPRPIASSNTTAVLVDVVVKDKKGRAVKDLRAEEFEIQEDGVRQQIDYFELVSRGSTAVGAAAATEAPAATEPKPEKAPEKTPATVSTGPTAVALVFDRLTTDARVRARDAALSYLGESTAMNGFVGVFAINLSLNTVQNYTTDAGLVKKGIEKAAALVSSTFDSKTLRPSAEEAAAQRQAQLAQAASSAGQGNSAAGSAAGIAQVDQFLQQAQSSMQETFEALQRDQQGYATVNSLMALVNSLRRLPGRKAVIFFSEGLSLPPNVQQHFRSVINSANRANVSVYAVDAAGLRTESTLAASRDEINARSRRRMDNLDRIANSTDGPLTKGLERNEDLLQLNPHSGLSQLAAETGGAFFANTNQIGPKLREIDEDLGAYYMLTYTPGNENFDGKFRNISVKVKRGGVDVLARKGYYAVPPTGSTPMFYYEAMPLAALNKPSPPKDFPLLVTGLHFPENDRPGRVAIEVEAPASAFTFANDTEKKVYSTDFSFVVLIKDQNKQVVDKVSHHYALIGPGNAADGVKKTKILFYRDINLPPGRYDLEAVAHDALSNKASVNRVSLELPEGGADALRLSSIALIQRAEQAKEKLDSPFRIGEVLIYPNLGEPVRKAGKQMGFYFNIYPARGATDLPKLTLELLQSGKSLVQLPLKLTPPDETGRIQFASGLPLESLSPGAYVMKISVSDAKKTVSRSIAFTLEP
jgi:VWFA-related protein